MRSLLALLTMLLFPLSGCTERPTESVAAGVASMVPAPAATSDAPGRVFEREQVGGRPCKLLTPGQLAAAAGVDAARISESSAMRCLFTWDEGRVLVQASVHSAQGAAERYFDGLTADITAEQMAEQKRLLQERLAREAGENGAGQDGTAVQGAVVSAIPDADVTNEPIDGLGDEASIDDAGKVTVRIGNLIFKVVAQRGSDDVADPVLARALAARAAENLEAL